jgi:hypothetical protein
MWSPRTMFPYRTLAGNRCGINRPSPGIEPNNTVGEASILRQVEGAFLPHPTLRRVTGSKTSARTLLRDNPFPVSGPTPMFCQAPIFHALARWTFGRYSCNYMASSFHAASQRLCLRGRNSGRMARHHAFGIITVSKLARLSRVSQTVSKSRLCVSISQRTPCR